MLPRDATFAEYALILALIFVTIISAVHFTTGARHPEPAPRLAFEQLQAPRAGETCINGQVYTYTIDVRGEHVAPAVYENITCKPIDAAAATTLQP